MRDKQAVSKLFHSIASIGCTFPRHGTSVMDTHDRMRTARSLLSGGRYDSDLCGKKNEQAMIKLDSSVCAHGTYLYSSWGVGHSSIRVTSVGWNYETGFSWHGAVEVDQYANCVLRQYLMPYVLTLFCALFGNHSLSVLRNIATTRTINLLQLVLGVPAWDPYRYRGGLRGNTTFPSFWSLARAS